jgi:hypothetical protein
MMGENSVPADFEQDHTMKFNMSRKPAVSKGLSTMAI